MPNLGGNGRGASNECCGEASQNWKGRQMTLNMTKAKAVGAVAVISLGLAACGTNAQQAAIDTKTYENTGGSVLIDTKYGQFGPTLAPGVASITAEGGAINLFTLSGSPVPDGGFGTHMSWRNVTVTLNESTVGGAVTDTTATLNATGMEIDVSGSLCVTYGIQYCDTFDPGSPLSIYISPGQTVTATGQVAADGSFDLTGTATVTVDSTTLTGWALGYLIDGSQVTLDLEGMKAS